MKRQTARRSKKSASKENLKAIRSMPAEQIAAAGSKLLLNMSVADVISLVQNRSGPPHEILLGSIMLRAMNDGDVTTLFALCDQIIGNQ